MIKLENDNRVLYQWALNQRVVIDCCKPGTRVEFSEPYKDTEPLPVAAYEESGHVYAPVPNILLQADGYICVRLCPSAGSSQLPWQKEFRVVRREKPEDYEYSETPLLQTTDEMFAKIKADPAFAAYLEEVKREREECKRLTLLCNRILQDCIEIRKNVGGEGK